MKQFVIVGLDTFGIRMLEQLSLVTNDIIIIDKDPETVNQYKDLAHDAFIMNAINEKALETLIPRDIDAAIVDLGSSIEASIMVTNHLKKMDVKEIIVKAESDELGNVLKIVGATKVIYPDREAAKGLTPLLASSSLFQYMPVSPSLVLAEVRIMEEFVGKSVRDSNFRSQTGIHIVALRKDSDPNFTLLPDADYTFTSEDILLIAGPPHAIQTLVADEITAAETGLVKLFRFMFTSQNHHTR